MTNRKTNLFVTLTAAAFLAVASSANAAQVIIEYGFEYSGAASPVGTPPWLIATFDDDTASTGLDAGHVQLTFEATNLTGTEFVRFLLFNFDTALDATDLTFDIVSNTSADLLAINLGTDAFNGDGAHGFDIEIQFDNAPPGNRFIDGDVIVFDISSSAGALLASSFDFGNPSGGSDAKVGLISGAHVQAINGEDSGWVTRGDDDDDDDDEIPTVPAPAAFPAGLALLGLATLRRRRAA